MLQPFTINRKVDGQETEIPFNTAALESFEGNEYNVVKNGIINDMSELGEFDVKIEVEMNTLQRKEVEMNIPKSLAAGDSECEITFAIK